MNSRDFASRLNSCMSDGNLTVADISRWFCRPHPTVRGWIKHGFDPRGGPHDVSYIHAMLDALETIIKRRKDLPLKRGISRAARIRHIEGLRRDIDTRLSKKDSAR
jgi:hypothetical protein